MKFRLTEMRPSVRYNVLKRRDRPAGHRSIPQRRRCRNAFLGYLQGKYRRNKRGEEMVEASIVLPVLILTILSLILLILYYYACLNCQVELHGELISDTENRKAVFKVVEKRETVSSEIGGVISMIMQKEITASAYAIGPADMIRAGELIGLE